MKPLFFAILMSLGLFLTWSCQKKSAVAFSAKGPAAGEVVRCPVCRMKIAVADDTPKSIFKGRVFYFDEPEMKSMFEKNPMKYLNADLSINSNKAVEGH